MNTPSPYLDNTTSGKAKKRQAAAETSTQRLDTLPSPVMSNYMGHTTTLGRVQRPQTLPPNDDHEESGGEEDPDSNSYNDEEDKGTYKSSMLDESHTSDLRAIMASIQALASTVASLQLTYDRQ